MDANFYWGKALATTGGDADPTNVAKWPNGDPVLKEGVVNS